MRAKVASRYVQHIWQKNARLKCPKKKEREIRDDRHSNEYWLCNNNGDYSIGRNCCPKQHIKKGKKMLTDGVKYWFATPDKKGIVARTAIRRSGYWACRYKGHYRCIIGGIRGPMWISESKEGKA